jgi:hypothetical protein
MPTPILKDMLLALAISVAAVSAADVMIWVWFEALG